MEIHQHALENYLSRVLNIQPEMAGDDVWEFAEEQIELAIKQPEMTYQKTSIESPIHIRNGVAVPVRDGDEVPTAYSAGVFLSKMRRYKHGQRKPA